MFTNRVVVGKGQTVQRNPEDPRSEWVKVYYEAEVTLGQGESDDKARMYLEDKLRNWMGDNYNERVPANVAPGTPSALANPVSQTTAPIRAQPLLPDIPFEEYLDIRQVGTAIEVRATTYLLASQWQQVHNYLAPKGFHWVSQGKASLWLNESGEIQKEKLKAEEKK